MLEKLSMILNSNNLEDETIRKVNEAIRMTIDTIIPKQQPKIDIDPNIMQEWLNGEVSK